MAVSLSTDLLTTLYAGGFFKTAYRFGKDSTSGAPDDRRRSSETKRSADPDYMLCAQIISDGDGSQLRTFDGSTVTNAQLALCIGYCRNGG